MSFTSTLASLIVNVVVNTQRVQANLQLVQNQLTATGNKANATQLAFAKIRTAAAGLYIAKNIFNAMDGALRDIILTAAELEQQFIHIQQAANLNSSEFKIFKEDFIELVENLKFIKIGDLQRIAVVASQAGVSGGNLLKFTESVAKAAAVSESLNAEELAKFFLLLEDKFKTGPEMTDRYANALGRLAMEFRTNEAEIVKVVTKITGSAQAFGLNEQQILAWGAAVRASGINAERASGSLLDFFNILSGTKAGNAGSAVGLDSSEFVKLIKEKPNDALLIFLQKLGQYGKNSNQTLINAGFESKRTKDTLQQLAIEYEKVIRAMSAADEGIKTTKDNQRKLEKQVDAIDAAINRLTNSWTIFRDVFGKTLGPPILDMTARTVEELNKALTVFQDYELRSGGILGFELQRKQRDKLVLPKSTNRLNVQEDKDAEATKEEEKATERLASKEKKFNEQLEDLAADTLPDLDRKLQDLDNKFRRLAEQAKEDVIDTDDRKKKLKELNAVLRQNILLEDDERQRKENERDLKEAEQQLKQTQRDEKEARRGLASALATDKQDKFLQIESKFDNLISNLKAAGVAPNMQQIQKAFNRDMSNVNADSFKIVGIEQAWQRIQENTDKDSQTAILQLQELQKLNDVNEKEMQILRDGLPPRAVFQ